MHDLRMKFSGTSCVADGQHHIWGEMIRPCREAVDIAFSISKLGWEKNFCPLMWMPNLGPRLQPASN